MHLRQDTPIVRSRLQKDWYYVTMGFFAWKRHRDVQVRWGFTNRSKHIVLGERIDIGRLREELQHVATLPYTEAELRWMWDRYGEDKPDGFLTPEYIDFLRVSKLSAYDLEPVSTPYGASFRFEPHGAWCEGMDWETFFLPILTHLNADWVLEKAGITREEAHAEALFRHGQKIERLRQVPDFQYGSFGLRRQLDFKLSRMLDERAIREIPNQLKGISCVWLAKELDWPVIGTFAHQGPMVYSGICPDDDAAIRASHMGFFDDWSATLPAKWWTAVMDTFGSKSFFEDFGPARAAKWMVYKQDSGNPFAEADALHDWLKTVGVDSKTKVFNPTDGTTIDLNLSLRLYLKDRYKAVVPGWGTTYSNDCGVPTFGSFVVKAIEANGRKLAKLSNDLAKASGDPATVARLKRIHGYEVTYHHDPVV